MRQTCLGAGGMCGKLVGSAPPHTLPQSPTICLESHQKVFCEKSVLQMVSAPQKRVTTCTTRFCDVEHGCRKNLRRKRLGRFGKLTENQNVYRTPPPAPQQVFRKPCSARPESFPHPGFSLPKLKCRKRVFSTPQHYVCRLTGLQAPR